MIFLLCFVTVVLPSIRTVFLYSASGFWYRNVWIFITEWKSCKIDTWACAYYDHNLLVLPSNKFIHNMKNTKCHTLTTVTKHNRKIIKNSKGYPLKNNIYVIYLSIFSRNFTTKEMILIFSLWTFHLYVATFQQHLHRSIHLSVDTIFESLWSKGQTTIYKTYK
jgi:hypothetical protein